MRKFSLCLAALLLSAVVAHAEGGIGTKAEVFGGFQYTRTEGGTNWTGWNTSLTGNAGKVLGITADFSQTYNSGVHFTTYTFGPEVHAHMAIVKPFVHALFGGARLSASGVSANGFATYIGGGLDAGHGTFALRVAQFDWMYNHFSGVGSGKNVRVSTGVVVRF